MSNAPKTPFVFKLDDAGEWGLHRKQRNGKTRPATRAELAKVERRWRNELRRTGQDVADLRDKVLYDPGFVSRLILAPRYQQYVRWKRGLAPRYRPTYVDQLLLAAEDARVSCGIHSTSGKDADDGGPGEWVPSSSLVGRGKLFRDGTELLRFVRRHPGEDLARSAKPAEKKLHGGNVRKLYNQPRIDRVHDDETRL